VLPTLRRQPPWWRFILSLCLAPAVEKSVALSPKQPHPVQDHNQYRRFVDQHSFGHMHPAGKYTQ
jgi:hypothetical protein